MRRRSILILIGIFVLGCVSGTLVDVPCFDITWSYSSSGGKCYKLIGKDQPANWMDASWSCQQILSGQSQIKVRLTQFNNEVELRALIEVMLQMGNMNAIWIGASRATDQTYFSWQNQTAPADFPFLDWSGGQGTGNCLRLSYLTDVHPTSSNWKTDVTLENVECEEKLPSVCEHEVPLCQNPPGKFNKTTMEFSPPKPVPRSVVTAVCKEGSFMDSKQTGVRATGPNVNDTLAPNEYYCDGTRDSSAAGSGSDPERFQTTFKYSGYDVSECKPVECSLDELKSMVPKNGLLSSARNRQTERTYTQNQVNEFNIYGNIISIRCLPGYLFADRTVEKTVSCEMAPGSRTQGVYQGYSGTILPIPSTCEETTCMYETAVIKADYHMKPYMFVKNGTAGWINLTKHEGKPYALGAELRYYCEDGYETVNQNADFNITCSDTGIWNPQLIGCIAKTAELPSSSSGRFHNEPEEGKSAKQISSVMFILIFIFIGFIILLDLTTIGRDAKQLVSNLKLQKKRLTNKRRAKSQSQNVDTTPSTSSYAPNGADTFSSIRNRNG